MQLFELNAEPREDVGKGASRRLRGTGKLPGIIYGTSKEATPITLAQNELLHQLENEAFYSHILTLNVGKETEKVVLKDLQRHPFKAQVLHADFQRIDEKEKLTMRVPLHFLNEEKCIGVKQSGGAISHITTEIEISCLPQNLPEYIEVDLLDVNVGETIHLGELNLPEGVEIYALLHGGNPEQPVASVHIPRVIEEDEDVEGEEDVEGDEAAEATTDDSAASDDD